MADVPLNSVASERTDEKEKSLPEPLGPYSIERRLGEGGMAKVLAVRDSRNPGRKLALKLLSAADPLWVRLFRQEFAFLAASSHPNIVPVYDFGIDRASGVPYYVAERIEGERLRCGPKRWNEGDLIELLLQIGRALRFLHARGIVHGDIKPANILREAVGNRYILVDLGLAVPIGHPDAAGGGTPGYAPLEVGRGLTPDERSDLFSLGMTLVALATGRNPGPAPFSFDSFRPDFSRDLREVVSRLVEPEREERLRSASDLLEALHRRFGRPLETAAGLRAYAKAPRLAGRSELLCNLLRRLQEGIPRIALIAPVGLGKSRLIEELRRRLQLAGKNVTTFASDAGTRAVGILDRLTGDLRQGRPAAADRIGETCEGTDRQETLLAELLRDPEIGRQVLLVDDADRMAPGERRRLAAALARLPLPAALAAETASALADFGNAVAFTLEPLGAEGVADYFSCLAPKMHPAVLRAIVEKSAGSPLLLETIAADLLPDLARLERPESAERIRRLTLSGEAQAVFGRKVEGLSLSAKETLMFVSLSKFPVPYSELSADSLDALLSLHLVRFEEGGVAPVNPVIRSIGSEGLPPQRIRELHARLAEIASCQTDFDRPDLVAFHLLHSSDPAAAVACLRRALERFHRNHANEEGIELFSLAQAKLGGLPVEIRLTAAEMLARVGRFDDALGIYRFLLEQGPPGGCLGLLRRVADIYLKQRDLKNCFAAVAKAEAALPAKGDPDRGTEEAVLESIRQAASLLAGDLDAVEAIAGRISALGELAPIRERIVSLAMLGHACRRRNRWAEAVRHYREALRRSDACGFSSGRSMAWGSLALCFEERRRHGAAMEAYRRAIGAAEEASDYLGMAAHQNNLGRLAERLGDYGAALRSFARAVEIYERSGNRGSLSVALYRQTMLQHFLTAPPETGERLQHALGLAESSGNLSAAAYCRLALARLSPHVGRRRELLACARSLLTGLNDPAGLAELALAEWESRRHGDPSSAPSPADLPGRLRIEEKRRELGRLSPEFERACRTSGNPEWLARFLSLRARLGLLPAPAAEALSIFKRIAAGLEESLQGDYLALRHGRELAALARRKRPAARSRLSAVSRSLVRSVSAVSRSLVRSAPAESLAVLLDTVTALHGEREFERLAGHLVDAALKLTRAERGFLVIEERGDFRVLTSRNIDRRRLQEETKRFSRGVVRSVIETGRSLTENGVRTARAWRGRKSLVAANTRAFLCVPLSTLQGLKGALYLDRAVETQGFNRSHRLLAEALASQAAVALERARMVEEGEEQRQRIEHLNLELRRALSETEKELSSTRDLLKMAGAADHLSLKFPEFAARSPKMARLIEAVARLALSRSPVHISGESGSGKEMVARALHRLGPSAEKPFVAVGCGTVPADLFESSFFGHEKGAFTGAGEQRTGFFAQADGGTLFLDEVQDLHPTCQAKLLRAVEEMKFRPLGATGEVAVDVRIVSAANQNLAQLAARGGFREDLLYRLNVVTLEVPPLRERREDLPALVRGILEQSSLHHGIRTPVLEDQALAVLLSRNWPGNVRQLKNTIERIVTLLPKERKKRSRITPDMVREEGVAAPGAELREVRDRLSREMILKALADHRWNKTRAAAALGVTRKGLWKMIKRLELRP